MRVLTEVDAGSDGVEIQVVLQLREKVNSEEVLCWKSGLEEESISSVVREWESKGVLSSKLAFDLKGEKE